MHVCARLGAVSPGAQHVHRTHAVYTHDDPRRLVDLGIVQGGVDQLGQGPPTKVPADFGDHAADHDGGDRIHVTEARDRRGDTDQHDHRGDRIRAVMPGVGA